LTYTVLAVDATAGVIGVASVTASLSVGNAVPALDPSAAAVATQAWTNRSLRHAVLASIREGAQPAEALRSALSSDPGPEYRQVAVLTLGGDSASHTGTLCTPWAGERRGQGFVAIGNYLAGAAVLDAAAGVLARLHPEGMPDGAAPTPSTPVLDVSGRPVQSDTPAVRALSLRLMAALRAAQDAGGDARGARSACLLVARRASAVLSPPELDVDLRVDDGADPVGELERLLDLRLSQDQAPALPARADRTSVRPRRD